MRPIRCQRTVKTVRGGHLCRRHSESDFHEDPLAVKQPRQDPGVPPPNGPRILLKNVEFQGSVRLRGSGRTPR